MEGSTKGEICWAICAKLGMDKWCQLCHEVGIKEQKIIKFWVMRGGICMVMDSERDGDGYMVGEECVWGDCVESNGLVV